MKRGLSAVVTTLIIVLLVFVAVGIIWGVVQGVVSEGSKSISLGSFNEDLELQSAKIEGDTLVTTVKRNVDGDKEISKISFIFDNGTSSQIIERNANLSELNVKTFSFYFAELELKNINMVSVAPIYLSETGDSLEGEITDFSELKDSFNGTKNEGMFSDLGFEGVGKKEYTFSSNNNKIPEFRKAIVDPLDVLPGDIQTFTVEIYSPNEILNVTSFTELDHENITFFFEKVSESGDIETWEASWEVYDVHTERYRTHITAKDAGGNENTITLTWTDSCQSQIVHGAAESILSTSCTVTSVGGMDGGDIVVDTGATLTLDSGGMFVWNNGQTITISGTISLSGGSLQKGYLFYPDSDGDGYAPNTTLVYGPSSSKSAHIRASSASGTNDCYDLSSNVFPGQTSYFTNPYNPAPEINSYDYNCDSSETSQYTQTGGGCGSCTDEVTFCSPAGGGGTGWSGSAPACGNSGTYYTSSGICPAEPPCNIQNCNSETRTQACR